MAHASLSRRRFGAALGALGVSMLAGKLNAQVQGSEVQASVRASRRAWRGTTVAYRPMYAPFEHSRVECSRTPSNLPRALRPLDFDYEFEGTRRTPEEFMERSATLGLLILKDGKIVNETYRKGATAASPLYSASMSKMITSVLLGIAVKDGHIRSLEQPLTDFIPELRRTAYDGVTVRQLLQMRSGLEWDDDFTKPGPAQKIQRDSLFDNVRRYTDAAFSARRAHPPGEHHLYNSLDSAVAGWLLERATKQSITRYTSERLWKPAGMEASAFWMLDGRPGIGREFTPGGFNAVLRDYGRLGQMMLDGGVANGQRILPADYVRQSVTPQPGPAEPGGLYRFGFFWWLLDGTDAYTAMGGLGQYVYVNPGRRTVIAKESWVLEPPVRKRPNPLEVIQVDDETQAFFKAVAEWQPG